LVSPAAAPQPIDVDKVAYCMMAHSGPPDEAIIKKLMIAALQDDVPGMQSNVAELASAMLKLAMVSCGVGMDQLDDKEFEAVGQKYGEMMGEKIMTEAFAKIQ
jgi:hypothetical protein